MKLFCAVVSAVLLAACGGGGSKSPADKCHDLIDVTCDRVVDCFNPPPTHEDCVAQLEPQLPCDSAKSVGMTYDSCIDQLNNNTCDVLFPPDQNGNPSLVLPQDCVGVIMARDAVPVTNSSPMLEQSELFVSPE